MTPGDPRKSGPQTGRRIRVMRFLLPFALPPLYLGFWYLSLPPEMFYILLGLTAAYVIPPAGKESIIPIGIVMGLPWWVIASTLALTDCTVALFIAWNFEYAVKIPLVGPVIQSGMAYARRYADTHPRIHQVSTMGLIVFVFFPLQGSGAMNGSILGSLLGMSPIRVFGCIMAGSIASCLAIGLGSGVVMDLWARHPSLTVGVLVVLAVAGIGGYLVWRRASHRLRERRA